MPGILNNILSQGILSQSGGGILSKLSGGGGILSQQMGILNARIASLSAAGTPQAKIQALTSTLGQRLRGGGLLSGLGGGTGGSGGTGTTSTDARYATGGQVAVSLLPGRGQGRFT